MNEQQLAAVKQALEALEEALEGADQIDVDMDKAITALQSIISQDALDKKAENARELGLDYEPAPVQEKNQSPYPEYDRGFSNGWDRGFAAAQPAPVKTYHDGKPWPVAPKPWVGLSEEEINKLRHLVDWTAEWSHGRFAYELERLLREKNGGAA